MEDNSFRERGVENWGIEFEVLDEGGVLGAGRMLP